MKVCYIERSKEERENTCMWNVMWHTIIGQCYIILVSQWYPSAIGIFGAKFTHFKFGAKIAKMINLRDQFILFFPFKG